MKDAVFYSVVFLFFLLMIYVGELRGKREYIQSCEPFGEILICKEGGK